jgi:broad specificity phosphatase PhoE
VQLVLIRHGESVGNAERRIQGQGDYPLTDRGRKQSRRLAERLAAFELAAVYSSPIARARETAEVIAARHGLSVIPLPEVREYDFGEVAGLTYQDIVERYQDVVEAYRKGPDYPRLPGEEGRDAFRQRVARTLWSLAEQHPAQTVAVVTHAGPIAVFCLEVLEMPYRRPIPFAFDNGSLSAVEIRDGPATPGDPRPRAMLVTLNDTCHLDEGEAT